MGRRAGAFERVVVKVGSAVIAREGVLDPVAVRRLVDDVSDVLDEDARRRVVIVSSGAVAAGFRALGLVKPPKQIMDKQAAAAIGQPRLMRAYAEAFGERARARGGDARAVGQVLLTGEDIDHRGRFLNARNTLETMLSAGAVPIINENDSVSFDEIKLGDNDHLAAMVSGLVGADLLVILSSVAGVWDSGARRRGGGTAGEVDVPILNEVRTLRDGLKHVSSEKTTTGVGGMATKVKAACTAAALGTTAVISDGRQAGIVNRIVGGERVGTWFPPTQGGGGAIAARKKWIGFSARPRGAIVVDDGAVKAIVERGASLLPGGIKDVRGEFEIGALVEVSDERGLVVARGLSSYDAGELRAIKGVKSSQIEQAIGYSYRQEAVHRNEMMLVEESQRGVGSSARKPPVRSRGGTP